MNDNSSILESRDRFLKDLATNNEATCPCCTRRARINKLRVHSTLALMIGRLYWTSIAMHQDPKQWVHIEAFKPKLRTGNDFSIVKHWGLAEPMPASATQDKRSSGMWRLTDFGVAFVEQKTGIPKHAYVLDDAVVSLSTDRITIEDALNNKFSFSELRAHLGNIKQAAL